MIFHTEYRQLHRPPLVERQLGTQVTQGKLKNGKRENQKQGNRNWKITKTWKTDKEYHWKVETEEMERNLEN